MKPKLSKDTAEAFYEIENSSVVIIEFIKTKQKYNNNTTTNLQNKKIIKKQTFYDETTTRSYL